MEDRKRTPERDLPPQLVLREMVIERVGRTGRRVQLVKLDPFRDELWAVYGEDKVRMDFRDFRVVLTAFRPGEGSRPVVELALQPDRPVAPTRWTLTGRAGEEIWLVVDAVLDQLESLAETMGFRYQPSPVFQAPVEPETEGTEAPAEPFTRSAG
jgi:hypothetical protein